MKRYLSALIVVVFAGTALSGCGGNVRETLGLNKRAPDEFRVVSRPPLSLPPDFSLRPPLKPGAGGADFPAASDQAKAAILGEGSVAPTLEQRQQGATADTAVQPVAAGAVATPAEEQFLRNVGAEKADQSIRDKLYMESTAPIPQEEKGFFSRWMEGYSEPEAAKPDPVVDARKEAERLRTNKDAGKPLNQGETPTDENKKGGFFDGLLN